MEPAAQNPVDSRLRTFFSRVLSAENLAGDVRSAVIGSVTGSIIGAISALLTAAFLMKASVQYAIYVNDDGFGQPKGLFDLAEKYDPKLALNFHPKELRSVYVCEYKLISGENWKQVVLSYLDAYRDCFNVTARSEDVFVIAPNRRSSALEMKQSSFLCKCGT